MNTDEKKPSVYGTMLKILNHLNSPQEQKNLAGNLAAIRNSTGKGFDDALGVWPILFPLMPEEYLGNGSLSYEEKALLVSLQLYALGQQGSNKVMNDEKNSVGSALRHLRNEKSSSLDRRFNTMLTSTTFDEFTYHLRQIFKLGKSDNTFKLNFSGLADDLFIYQIGGCRQICLKWAKDYYRSIQKDEDYTSSVTDTSNNNDEKKEAL